MYLSVASEFAFCIDKALVHAPFKSQDNVSGTVKLKLYKGTVYVVSRSSSKSLYSKQLVTFEDDEGYYNQSDAEGFIKLKALRLRELARRNKKK